MDMVGSTTYGQCDQFILGGDAANVGMEAGLDLLTDYGLAPGGAEDYVDQAADVAV